MAEETNNEVTEEPKGITPKALASELEIDPKRLRGWLRKEHPRTAEAKGTSWEIEAEVADAARERFAKADDADEAEEAAA